MDIKTTVTTETVTDKQGEHTTIIVEGEGPITLSFGEAAAREYGRGWDTEPGPRSTRWVETKRDGHAAVIVRLFTPPRSLWSALEPVDRDAVLSDVRDRAEASERTAREYESQAANAERHQSAGGVASARSYAGKHARTALRWRALEALIVEVTRG